MQGAGDAVKAGTVNQSGYLEVISTATSKVSAPPFAIALSNELQ